MTPDTIFNLPNHHAVCSWISRGARVPAFLAQTIPLETDEEVIEHHLTRSASAAPCPDRLPDPLPDIDWRGLFELPTEAITSNGDGKPDGDAPTLDLRGPATTSNGNGNGNGNGQHDGDAPAIQLPEPHRDGQRQGQHRRRRAHERPTRLR